MGVAGQVDYESHRLTSEYLHFHYGDAKEVVPWESLPASLTGYPQRLITERFPAERVGRGLEVGCAVGRSSFEMARFCDEVVGIDYSSAFISTCNQLKVGNSLAYEIEMQGDRRKGFVATVPQGIDPSRVQFIQGDAHELPADLGSFDWVLGANLLCRLHHPRRFLRQLPGLVKQGGILVLNSPFTWMPQHTEPSEWIGGKEGEDSARILQSILDSDFELIDETQMPFLIRETERKYQLTVAHSGKWRRR